MTVERRSRDAAAGIHTAVAQVEPRVLAARRRFFGRRAFIALILAAVTPPVGVAAVNAIREDDSRTNLWIVDDGDRVPPRERTIDGEAMLRPGDAPTGGESRQAARTGTALAARTGTALTVPLLGLTGRLAFTAMDEPAGACDTDGDCFGPSPSEIQTMDLRTGRATPLTSSPLFENGARWSPDGSRLAYSLHRGDATADLYTIRADGNDNRRIVSVEGSAAHALTWSPDGRRIAFTLEPASENVCVGGAGPACGVPDTGMQEIWMVDADGTDLHRVEEIPSNAHPREPAWSPDGRYLAFVQGRYAEPGVYVLDFQTERIEWISSGSNPAWAPDGKRLAIANDDLEVVAVSSGQVIERINGWGPSLSEPAWSPDGEWIAFTVGASSPASGQSIWVARPNGASLKVVIEGPEHYGAPSWTVALR